MKTKKIAVIGSAFNPPHLGHKDIIEQIYQDFDEILLVPSFRHAFGKEMVLFQHRLYMASMLAQSFHSENFLSFKAGAAVMTSSIEREIGSKTDQPVYTYDVLNELEARYLNAGIQPELVFIVGPDNATRATWNKFHRGDEIVKRWDLQPVSERVPVHSSLIRNLIAEYHRPGFLFESRFKNYMDGIIADYIFNQKLYGARV